MKVLRLLALLAFAAAGRAMAAPELIVEASTPDAAAFEQAAARAKEMGATHLVITNDLPLAQWEFDTPGDPYPAWYAYRPSLLKIFYGPEVRPYVDTAYADRIVTLLEERCARSLGGLRAAIYPAESLVSAPEPANRLLAQHFNQGYPRRELSAPEE